MKTVTITLPLEQAEATAYALQLHMFARADALTAIEKSPAQNPGYQNARVGNASRDFMRTHDALDAFNEALAAVAREDSARPSLLAS